MNSNPSPIETEIKIRWDGSAAAARRRIEEYGYRLIEARTLESDQIFDLPGDDLTAAGKLVRLRRTTPDAARVDQAGADRDNMDRASVEQADAPTSDFREGTIRATVTYKGPGMSARYKSREEIEFDVSDANAFFQVLDRLGYVPRFFYQKFRTKFGAAGEPGMITLDETPIGVFLELEGPEYWIDATATRFGVPPSAYLTASYASLYREYRLQHGGTPVNMVFKNEQSPSTGGKGP